MICIVKNTGSRMPSKDGDIPPMFNGESYTWEPGMELAVAENEARFWCRKYAQLKVVKRIGSGPSQQVQHAKEWNIGLNGDENKQKPVPVPPAK